MGLVEALAADYPVCRAWYRGAHAVRRPAASRCDRCRRRVPQRYDGVPCPPAVNTSSYGTSHGWTPRSDGGASEKRTGDLLRRTADARLYAPRRPPRAPRVGTGWCDSVQTTLIFTACWSTMPSDMTEVELECRCPTWQWLR